MGHFDDCTPDQRFTETGHDGFHRGVGTEGIIIDWGRRRFIDVATTWMEDEEEFFLDALAERRAAVNLGRKEEEVLRRWDQAPGAFDWPLLPEIPEVPFYGAMLRRATQPRRWMDRRGARFPTWQRPPSCALPLTKGKKLLATGEMVERSR